MKIILNKNDNALHTFGLSKLISEMEIILPINTTFYISKLTNLNIGNINHNYSSYTDFDEYEEGYFNNNLYNDKYIKSKQEILIINTDVGELCPPRKDIIAKNILVANIIIANQNTNTNINININL